MKIYISFGQQHVHRVNGTTFDCDSLCEIKCESYADGRHKAFKAFSAKFAFSYAEVELEGILHHFPNGIKELN